MNFRLNARLSEDTLQLASNSPGVLVDWNNNCADDPDRCALFHCGNWAKSFIPGIEIKTIPLLGATFGEENTYGAKAGRAVVDSSATPRKPVLAHPQP